MYMLGIEHVEIYYGGVMHCFSEMMRTVKVALIVEGNIDKRVGVASHMHMTLNWLLFVLDHNWC